MNQADLEALAAIIIRMQPTPTVTTPATDRGGGGYSIKKDLMKHIQEYDGDREKYETWALKTLMCINTMEENLANVLKATQKKVEPQDEVENWQGLLNYYNDGAHPIDKWAKELYEVLGLKLQGTAFTILTNV